MENKIIVQLAQPERDFVRVYKDFLNCKLLTAEEKLIYIALKSFVSYGKDKDEVYPSMETLCKITSMSKPRATRTITSLVKKGIIKKQRRGLTKANLYTIVDVPSMWGTDTLEEMKTVSESQMSDKTNEELIAELVKRGAIIIVKEKEPDNTAPTKATVESSTKLNQSDMVNTTIYATTCQAQERYTLDDVKDIFGYGAMIHDAPELKSNIDSVMDVLHNALNTTAETIRINKKDVPGTVARKKLLELTNEEILFAIRRYRMQTGTINNPSSYILTQLFNAHRDMDLELTNKIQQQIYG